MGKHTQTIRRQKPKPTFPTVPLDFLEPNLNTSYSALHVWYATANQMIIENSKNKVFEQR